MEALARLVTDSLARHGFDRPVDPRRLQWSGWFRCDSARSLLVVPSKPGIFALAEEVMDLGPGPAQAGRAAADRSNPAVRTALPGRPAEPGSAAAGSASNSGEAKPGRRMLAVLQFSEDDDMAFTLDRMFTRISPMRERLSSGRCFLRFVVMEDLAQRRSICNALNQWMLSSAEKASGLTADFQSSLELTGEDAAGARGAARGARTRLSDSAGTIPIPAQGTQPGRETDVMHPAPHLDSGANRNLHCPHPLPSGF
jgi:hypothetical protein